MIDSVIYNMDDNVEIVNITNSTSYKTMSVNELSKSKVSKVTVYSDKSAKDGGIIRLVAVSLKN